MNVETAGNRGLAARRAGVPLRPWHVFGVLVALAAIACSDEPTAPGPTGTPDLAAEPEKLRLSMHAMQLEIGEDTTIVATLHDARGDEISDPPTGYSVVWSTSNQAVATVTDGRVSAVDEGAATVTAAAGSLPTVSVDVEVLAPESVIDGYEATALGQLPGASRSNAWDINNSGVLTGWSNLKGGRAFRWSQADRNVELPVSSSRGINDAGAVVGFYVHPYGFRAYVFRDGARTALQTLDRNSNSHAYRINDMGTVVGVSDPNAQAVVWTRGGDGTYGMPVALGARNINESPVVNDRGDIAFTAFISGIEEPVLWQVRPDGSYEEPLFLGRPAGGSHFVRDINDGGLIVGYRWNGAVEIAVLWHPDDYSTPIDLGVGQAWGVNSRDRVVGVTGGELATFGGVPRRPALWIVDSPTVVDGPYDIGTPVGFESAGARAINDDGWIVGSSWGPGEVMATLWRPE